MLTLHLEAEEDINTAGRRRLSTCTVSMLLVQCHHWLPPRPSHRAPLSTRWLHLLRRCHRILMPAQSVQAQMFSSLPATSRLPARCTSGRHASGCCGSGGAGCWRGGSRLYHRHSCYRRGRYSCHAECVGPCTLGTGPESPRVPMRLRPQLASAETHTATQGASTEGQQKLSRRRHCVVHSCRPSGSLAVAA